MRSVRDESLGFDWHHYRRKDYEMPVADRFRIGPLHPALHSKYGQSQGQVVIISNTRITQREMRSRSKMGSATVNILPTIF